MDRIGRFEDQIKSLEDALELSRTECSNLRKEAAYASAEAKFQSERALNFEETAKTSNDAILSTMARRAEVEGLLVAQQKECRILSEKLLQIGHNTKVTEDAIGRLEVEVQVSKASEERLMQQVAEYREELKRQASLSDSMLRIESGLSSRMEEEKNSLVIERDSLLKTLENLRKDLADNTLLGDQKIRSLEEDLRTTRSKIDEQTADHASVKEELIREQGISTAAQERGTLLEKQLAMAQERLASIQGTSTLDLVDASTSAQNEIALSKALTELENVKSQLVSADEHIEQFKKISAATEKTLAELRERFAAEKKSLQDELTTVTKDFADYKSEHESSRGVELELLKEVEELRENLVQTRKDHTDAIAATKEETNLAKQSADQAVGQMEMLKREVSKFQLAARTATQNYERELQLHAHDAHELRTMETEVDKIKAELETTNQRLTEISADAIRKERTLDEERASFNKEQSEVKENLVTLQRTNDLLHAQIQQYATKIEKYETGVQSSSAEEVTGLATGSSSAASGSGGSTDEVHELRQNISNLQEVMRNMKRERDIMEPKLSVAETEKTRFQGALATTQKLLDETRAELKKEIEKRVTVHDDASYAQLMSEVTQLNIVRESNAHLRSENQELLQQAAKLNESLNKANDALKPLQEQMRVVKTENSVKCEEIKALTADATYWKDRLHTLVSRYNDVDPEEHKLIMNDLNTAKEDLKKLETEKNKMQTELDNAKSEIEKASVALTTEKESSSQLQKSLDAEGRRVENFRNKLNQFKTVIDGLNKEKKTMADQNAELTTQLANAKKVSAAAMKKVAGAASDIAPVSSTPSAPTLGTAGSTASTSEAPETSAALRPVGKQTPVAKTASAASVASVASAKDDKDSAVTASATAPSTKEKGQMTATSEKSSAKGAAPPAKVEAAETSRATLLEKMRVKAAEKKAAEEKKATEEKEKSQPMTKKLKADASTPSALAAVTSTASTTTIVGATASSQVSTTKVSDAESTAVSEQKEMCKFFARNGKCRFGDDCEFSHDSKGSSATVCSFFSAGQECKYGDQCRFSHELPTVVSAASQDGMEIESVKDKDKEDKKLEKNEEKKETDKAPLPVASSSALNVNAGVFTPVSSKSTAATTEETRAAKTEDKGGAPQGSAFLETLRPPSPNSTGLKPPTFGSGAEKLPLPSKTDGTSSAYTNPLDLKSGASLFGGKNITGGGLFLNPPASGEAAVVPKPAFGESSSFGLFGKTAPATMTVSSVSKSATGETAATFKGDDTVTTPAATTQEEKKQLRAARFLTKPAATGAISSQAPAVNPFAVTTPSAATVEKPPKSVSSPSPLQSRKRSEPTEDTKTTDIDGTGVPATKTMKLDLHQPLSATCEVVESENEEDPEVVRLSELDAGEGDDDEEGESGEDEEGEDEDDDEGEDDEEDEDGEDEDEEGDEVDDDEDGEGEDEEEEGGGF